MVRVHGNIAKYTRLAHVSFYAFRPDIMGSGVLHSTAVCAATAASSILVEMISLSDMSSLRADFVLH